MNNRIEMKDEILEQIDGAAQSRIRSVIWWVGMADAVVAGLAGVLIAAGLVSPEVGGAVIAGSAIVFAYCNGNNPSIRGKY